jgi:hypothetical protein
MILEDQTMAQDDTNGAEPRNATARDRLEALKARRAGKGAAGLMAAPGGRAGRGAAAGGKGGKLKAMFTAPENAQKRKALMKLVQIMRDTPDDGTGMVTGTNFSQAGVKKVVDTLQSRSREAGAQGGKAATLVLKMLTTAGKDGGGETVHGVQVSRLAKLSQLAKR